MTHSRLWTRSTLTRHLFQGRRLALVGAVVMLMIAAVAHIVVPLTLARVVDGGLIAGNSDEFFKWSLILLGVSLVNPLTYLLGYRRLILLEAGARKEISKLAVRSAVHAGTRQRRPGEIVNVMTGDSDMVSSLFTTVGHGVMNVVAFGLGLVLVWSINPWLGVAIGGGVIATTAIAGPLLGRLEKRWGIYRNSLSTMADLSTDTVGGVRVLRGLGAEVRFWKLYVTRSREVLHRSYSLANHSSWIEAMQYAIPFAYMAVVTWVGARLTLSGGITVGEFGAAFGYASALMMYSGSLLSGVQALVGVRVSAKHIVTYLNRDLGAEVAEDAAQAFANSPEITVKPGELTVIRGSDTALIRRAFELLVDESPHTSLLVDHDDYLFSGSLKETLKAPPAAEEAVITAVSGKDIVASLGGSTNGWIDERGMNLSGGQRQRTVLARGLARNPATLLLCDPTTGVDAVTELAVVRGVTTYRKERTTIMATQSSIWASLADRVIDADEPFRITVRAAEAPLAKDDDGVA